MKKFFMYGLILSLGVIGCDRIETVTVFEQSKITNRSGADLELEVCKLPFKQMSPQTCPKWPSVGVTSIKIDTNQSGLFELSKFQAQVILGGRRAKPHDSYVESQIFLTENSITQVKLCRDKNDAANVSFVDLLQTCPANTDMQTDAVTDCESALPIGLEIKQ